MAVIYAFGDSITYGAWDIEKSGWATRLRVFLDEKQQKDPSLYYLLYNLGIPGETTEGLVARFADETEARGRGNQEVIFIFAFGANDNAYLVSKERFRVPKETYISNLDDVITKAQAISSKIMLLNITPVIDEANALPRNDKVRANSYVKEYNEALEIFAKEKGLPLVDVYSVFMDAGYESLFDEDGLHPNAEGHQLIFKAVKPVIEKLLK